MNLKHLQVITLSLFVFTSCIKNDNPKSFIENASTDFESLTEDQEHILFEGSSNIGYNISNRTDSIAHSGKFSYHIYPQDPYILTFELDSLQPQSIIDLSFWCYGEAPLIVIQEINVNIDLPSFYYANSEILKNEPNGWKLIGIKKRIPSNIKGAKIYLWNADKKNIFIDDYSFKNIRFQKRVIKDAQLLKIMVDSISYAKLSEKRVEAFKNGVLEASDDDYVKAKIIYLNDTIKSKIRLKGDWLDHLAGDKWSFRIKLKKDSSWKGMQTFSIQAPETRGYIHEWVAHELFKKMDVLTPRYGFINVELNGVDLGVYAYEEFFEKQLIESNERREGPILKFSEDNFWFNNRIEAQTGRTPMLPYEEAGVILPFKESKITADPNLLNQFKNGQNLMLHYRDMDVDIDKIFDVDKLAKYCALINITGAFHGIAWHNQRFYYNPVVNLLEPIAYDGYTQQSSPAFFSQALFGSNETNHGQFGESFLYMQYFTSKSFYNNYYEYLKEYSSANFIDTFYAEIKYELKDYIELIKSEYYYYQYDSTLIPRNINIINNLINNSPNCSEPRKTVIETSPRINKYDTINTIEATQFYIKAYLENSDFESYKFKIVNNYSMDIKLVGYNTLKGEKVILKTPKTIGSINRNNNSNKFDITIGEEIVNFLYTVDGVSSTPISLNYYKWNYPTHFSPRIELLESANNTDLNKYIVGNTIVIPSGKTTFSKPLIIPQKYTLIIKPGATIDLTNKAFIMSFGPVRANGTENNKIVITSSDGTAMGFIVIQAKDKSEVSYTTFDQLNTLNYKGWSLTGAVTFYECDVTIDHTIFSNNRSEDALNTVRSKFKLNSCKFDNIYADAFDSDFSNGTVNNSSFYDVGNDAIDFSGSNVDINDCKISHTGDKGVSGGEQSYIKLNNVFIDNTIIAVASKDKSQVFVTNSTYVNSSYGLICFRKKPEYGPAFISTTNCKHKNINTPLLIELNSTLVMDGDTINGQALKVASIFY